MVVVCLVLVAVLPPHGKKSRTPSVKARVVGIKQQFPKFKEGLFHSIYISFTRFLPPHLFFYCCLFNVFYRDLFLFKVRLFLARRC